MVAQNERAATLLRGKPSGSDLTCDEQIVTSRPAPGQARMLAWRRIIESVAEQREALDHRIWRADPDDRHLGADCQTWCELSRALADFLKARRAA